MAKITSDDIRELLEKRFDDSRQYVVAHEVGNSTGLAQLRRIDMVVVNCYESQNFSIEGIEIKVSKSDLRTELQHSEKHNIFFRNLDYFSLACPAEILDMSIIPKKWGVYVVKDGKLVTHRKPLSLHDEGLHSVDKGFLASLIRAIANRNPNSLQNVIYRKIEDARQEGFERGHKAAMTSMQARDYERLQSYDKLFREIGLWYDADGALQEFRKFRDLNLDRFEQSLSRIYKDINRTLDLLHSTRKAIITDEKQETNDDDCTSRPLV